MAVSRTVPATPAEDRTAVLELSGLAVGYRHGRRARTVLRDVDASIAPGELVCLVGPNGAGKSTLLRTVAGLQPALAGDVALAGEPLARLKRREIAASVAAVLTDRVDPGRLRVRELVGLGRHPHTNWTGRLDHHDRVIVEEALQRCGAAALADVEFDQISDGQRQRVLMARALAQEPRLLLLDEPTAFLDPPARIALLALLAQIAAERGVGVLVSTHDIEVAARRADTLWVANLDGTVTVGGPEDLVHSGAMVAPFSTPGTSFDATSLSFTATAEDRPRARIDGEGTPAVLAAHALRRAGYEVGDDDPAAVVVAIRPGEARNLDITLRSSAGERRHTSLDALARHARALRERP